MAKEPVRAQFLRRQQVAFELGISRHTLARVIKADPDFPRFIPITPGIEVITRADFEGWLRSKRFAALVTAKLPKVLHDEPD
jgi:predicted DNA-binding transcriptional regulator AlpA